MRFSALDALRGICALIVVLFHIEILGNIYAGSLHGVPFILHGYMFVDFFFVLSGFVLTHAYFNTLNSSNDVLAFMIRRTGRVYPLHLAVLLLFVVLELGKVYAYARGIHVRQAPFETPYSLPSLIPNLLLLQGMGIYAVPVWNGPSWSISVEFYNYLLFAICAVALRHDQRKFVIVSAVLALIGAGVVYAYSPHAIDTTSDFGFFRCVYGFFVGAITCIAFGRVRGRIAAPGWLFSLVELVVVALCVLFVCAVGPVKLSLISPLVFAVPVAVFAFDGGAISRVLKTRPLQFMGDISYTLYISHAFILLLMSRMFAIMQQKTHLLRTIPYFYHDQMKDLVLPTFRGGADLVVVIIMVLIVLLCVIINRWIEIPCRDLFGRLAKHVPRG